MRFGAVGSIGVVSTLAGGAAAIIAAWQGAGYWALVVQPGVSAIVGTVLAFGAVGYRPTAEGSLRESVDLLKFGAKSTGSAMLHNVVRNADNIIIGRASGEAALGQYTMAYRLLLMPIRQINNPLVQVAVPTLSRLQDDPERYRRFYVHALRAATAFGMPLVGLLALLSGHLIPLLLGPGWGAVRRPLPAARDSRLPRHVQLRHRRCLPHLRRGRQAARLDAVRRPDHSRRVRYWVAVGAGGRRGRVRDDRPASEAARHLVLRTLDARHGG
jgi:hypothetical protein